MPHPSFDQVKELARQYAGMALSVSIYRFNNWNSLTDEQRRSLEQQHWSLESYAQDFLRDAAQLVFSDVQADLSLIGETTSSIAKDLGKLTAIQHVLDIVGGVMTLAGAIISKEPAAILKQAKSLADSWKALQKPPSRGGRSANVPKAGAPKTTKPKPSEKATPSQPQKRSSKPAAKTAKTPGQTKKRSTR